MLKNTKKNAGGKPKKQRAARKRAINKGAIHTRNPVTQQLKTIVRPGDERTAQESASALVAPAAKSTITHNINNPAGHIYGPIIAWVTAAAQRGYYASASNPNFLYWAYVYAIKVLGQAANGAPILAQQVPYWMKVLCISLSPKETKLDQGEVSYRLSVDATTTAPSNVNIGAIAYGYEWRCDIPGAASPTGYPLAVPPAGYTSDDNGIQAFNDVSTFMMTSFANSDFASANSLVPYAAPLPKWQKDVSCFAFTTNAEGIGYAQVGGIAQVINHQVPIQTPQFSVFGQGATTTQYFDANRYPVYSMVGAGDSITVGNNLVQGQPEKNWRSKRKPLIHSIDFLQFGDVLARYVSKLQQQRFSDVGASTIVDPLEYKCPLSLQETLLVLRNEAMYLFGQTQTGYQGVLPRGVPASTDNAWTPFLAGPSTVALTGTGMKLPLILVENLKSLLSRVVYYHGDKDAQYFIGVLGQYAADVLDTTAYTYEVVSLNDPVPMTIPSFRVDSAKEVKLRDSRGNSTWVGVPETAISLVDGSTASSYLFINDPSELQRLTTLWNEWVSKLAQYSSSLTTISRDLGCNIACGTASTRHWFSTQGMALERTESSRDTRFLKPKFMASPFTDRLVAATSFHAAPLAGPWEQVLSQFILPVNKLAGNGPADTTYFARMQDIMKEPFSISETATGDNGETLVTILDSLASKMVHGRDAPPSDLENFFVEQTKLGRAGILSSLAASFLGSAFGPTAGAIANAVADALPI